MSTRLFLFNAGLSLFALLVSGALSFVLVERYVQTHEEEQLGTYARNLAEQIAPYMLPVVKNEEVNQVLGLYSLLGDFQVRVLDDQWKQIARSPDSSPGSRQNTVPGVGSVGTLAVSGGSRAVWHIFRRANGSLSTLDIQYICTLQTPVSAVGKKLDAQSQNGDGATAFGVKTFSSDRRSIIAEIDGPEHVLGYIEMWHLNDHVTEALKYFPTAMLLAILAALALALGLGMLFAKGMTRPLSNLRKQASSIAAGDLSVRTRPEGISIQEVRELGEGFNTMADRIQAMVESRDSDRRALRSFLDDVAHEMRTPLSAISNFVELLQGAAANDEHSRHKFLAECGHQIDKLEWLNKSLLDLARLDSGVLVHHTSPQPAREVLQEAIGIRRTALESKNLGLVETFENPDLAVDCDREWLVIALSNILDNAIKHAPSGSQISVAVRVSPDGKGVVFSVADQGQGIAEEHLPKIFERFYRVSQRGPGCGLGLAMVKSIVDRHAGRILVDSTPGKGFRIEVILPASSEATIF